MPGSAGLRGKFLFSYLYSLVRFHTFNGVEAMFKDYKGIFKDLRNMQEQLWKESMASFPGAAFPGEMNEWQQKTLENINDLVGQAVSQSLELQREWLDQWAERAGGKKIKPKLFAELNAEALNSTQRWLDKQNQLWDQWLQVLRGTGGTDELPEFRALGICRAGIHSTPDGLAERLGEHAIAQKAFVQGSRQAVRARSKNRWKNPSRPSNGFGATGSRTLARPCRGKRRREAAPKKRKSAVPPNPRRLRANRCRRRRSQTDRRNRPGSGEKLKDAGIHTLRRSRNSATRISLTWRKRSSGSPGASNGRSGWSRPRNSLPDAVD